MGKIRIIALCWLVFLSAFSLGIIVYDTKIWPYDVLRRIKKFVDTRDSDNLSLSQKLENDLNFKPSRFIKVNDKGESEFADVDYSELQGLQLKSRRNKPRIYLSDIAPAGYRIIFGTFDFEEGLHGAIMIDPAGNVSHVWHVSQEGAEWKHQPDTNVFPHGFEISPDGSIVVAFDGGSSLTKYDYCGNTIWRIEGLFHHSIHFEGDTSLWAWQAKLVRKNLQSMVKIDYETGSILKVISLQNVVAANPDIDIFGILQTDSEEGSSWLTDPWHPNDVEPLSALLVQYYPSFSAGDLLVSLRHPNLIFVMDQETYRVKWWRQGQTRRQHDPDWNVGGTITVFDNNTHRDYSSIIEMDPVTFDSKKIVDGKKYSFYTYWRGKHQTMPNGNVLVTSPDQGRVFEIDKDGNIVFDFINIYGEDGEFLSLSEARFLPVDFFKELPQCH